MTNRWHARGGRDSARAHAVRPVTALQLHGKRKAIPIRETLAITSRNPALVLPGEYPGLTFREND